MVHHLVVVVVVVDSAVVDREKAELFSVAADRRAMVLEVEVVIGSAEHEVETLVDPMDALETVGTRTTLKLLATPSKNLTGIMKI